MWSEIVVEVSKAACQQGPFHAQNHSACGREFNRLLSNKRDAEYLASVHQPDNAQDEKSKQPRRDDEERNCYPEAVPIKNGQEQVNIHCQSPLFVVHIKTGHAALFFVSSTMFSPMPIL
jgi:hypothetical protein